jgi:hypothetical protein
LRDYGGFPAHSGEQADKIVAFAARGLRRKSDKIVGFCDCSGGSFDVGLVISLTFLMQSTVVQEFRKIR